jgi:hypothetical protein
MTWEPQTHEDYDTLKGFDVYASDNARIGRITSVFHPPADMPDARGAHYFLVETGDLAERFGNDEIYIHEPSISEVDADEDRVVLEIPSDALRDQSFNRPNDFTNVYRRT